MKDETPSSEHPAASEDLFSGDLMPVPEEPTAYDAIEAALERVRALRNRTPEQLEADIERARALSRPAAPLPPGKTWVDMVVGKWPGNETDEQILKALEDLS